MGISDGRMAGVHAQEVTILELGGSSGTLELVGVRDQTGWKFQVRTHETGILDEDQDWRPPRADGLTGIAMWPSTF
jgi:hypothetical protein